MEMFFIYLLKSSVCLAVFYLFYRLLLSRETFHRFNRMALLSLLVLSCVVPLCEVTLRGDTDIDMPFYALQEVLVTGYAPQTAGDVVESAPAFMWLDAVLIVYLLGVVFFIVRNVWSFVRLWSLVRSGNISKDDDGIFIITHTEEIAPFSWMRFIILSEKDKEENGREILTHERAHINAHHSVDLLVADLCVFFQWFNPAAWLLKRELQAIHEYEADESVIEHGVDAKAYQLLIIKKAVGSRLFAMANSFNHGSLKQRIGMMAKSKSNPWLRCKYLYVLPVIGVALVAFARPEASVEPKELYAAPEPAQMENEWDMEPLFQIVEEMPEFPNGQDALVRFLSSNVKYPPEAQSNNLQGRVIVEFIVEKDGTVTNPEVKQSVCPELDAEALRLVGLMPKWNPGKQRGREVRVRMTIPIMFRLG